MHGGSSTDLADLRHKIILTRKGRLRARASKGQLGHSMGVVIRPLIRFFRAGGGRKNALQEKKEEKIPSTLSDRHRRSPSDQSASWLLRRAKSWLRREEVWAAGGEIRGPYARHRHSFFTAEKPKFREEPAAGLSPPSPGECPRSNKWDKRWILVNEG